MALVRIPSDLHEVLDEAWQAAKDVPGFLTEDEARFLGLAAACTPGEGAIVEIGSFKGKSTVMLGKVVQHYRLGKMVAIDPHNFHSEELQAQKTTPEATTFDAFQANLAWAGVSDVVDVRRDYSTQVARGWNAPIRFLWIDGDHSYRGAKDDFDGFMPYVVPEGVVALHDALHEFAGPIRVFVEDMLRSPQFGAAGFVNSIAWAQFRPADGAAFREQKAAIEKAAAPLLPYFATESELTGLKKIGYKLKRSRVPRGAMQPETWASLLNRTQSR